MVADGADNAAIALRLFRSDKTVRNHVAACLTELEVGHCAETVTLARDAGIGSWLRIRSSLLSIGRIVNL